MYTFKDPALAPDMKAIPPERLKELQEWLTTEVHDALAARGATERRWSNSLRQYNSIPKNPARNIPIENAPNVHVALGAIGTDSIYAQILDLIWNITPLVTVNATNNKYIEHSKAMQRWVTYVTVNELNIREQSDHAILDDVMLGTGVMYTPWVENTRKTNVQEIVWQGPRTFAVPPEDVIVPGGSAASPQDARWIALRFWYTKNELEMMATTQDWDIEQAKLTGGISTIKSERERLAGTASNGKRVGDLYEILIISALYDIDHDGLNEDLSIVWDRSSGGILSVDYNSYDHRPISKMNYQIRAHQWDGIGILEMLSMLEEGASDIMSYWVCNMMLSNCRMWAGPPGTVETPFIVHPNKWIECSDPDKIKELKMSDVYSSGPQAVAMLMSLGERRTGMNDMSMPRPSQVLGSRTPATTSMMLFQQVNKRFTPAFDQVRLCMANVVMQAMYRYQEQLLANNAYAAEHIADIMGEDASLVIEVLKDKRFDEAIAIELTASSATVNREVERQNAMFLVGLLAQYYQKVIELTTIVANPQTPPPVAEVAKKIAIAAGEAIERTIRTFDQVRDPQAFIVNFENEIDAAAAQAQDTAALQSLMTLVQGGQQTPPIEAPMI